MEESDILPERLEVLCDRIRDCRVCEEKLDHVPRPVFVAHRESKIVIIGQAPGSKVHESGIAWADKSGDNLREWMGVTEAQFYNPQNFAIVPMGFCYPGKGRSGDLPPRKECAPLWHDVLLSQLTNVELTLLIGSYAQKYYLGEVIKRTLTETVRSYETYLPDQIVLPHPSPRNNIWISKNPWFKTNVLPYLKERIRSFVANP